MYINKIFGTSHLCNGCKVKYVGIAKGYICIYLDPAGQRRAQFVFNGPKALMHRSRKRKFEF